MPQVERVSSRTLTLMVLSHDWLSSRNRRGFSCSTILTTAVSWDHASHRVSSRFLPQRSSILCTLFQGNASYQTWMCSRDALLIRLHLWWPGLRLPSLELALGVLRLRSAKHFGLQDPEHLWVKPLCFASTNARLCLGGLFRYQRCISKPILFAVARMVTTQRKIPLVYCSPQSLIWLAHAVDHWHVQGANM